MRERLIGLDQKVEAFGRHHNTFIDSRTPYKIFFRVNRRLNRLNRDTHGRVRSAFVLRVSTKRSTFLTPPSKG